MNQFLKDTLFGSFVLLPIAVMVAFYAWLVDQLQIIVNPLKPFLPEVITRSESASALLVIFLMIGALFFIGLILRTSVGSFIYRIIESKILVPFAPGYKFVVESIKPFLPSNQKKPFKQAVIARPYSDDSFVIGFLTDEYDKGIIGICDDTILTVYVGTAPIPTSGYTLLLKASRVEELKGVSVDEVIRTVIACGVGSGDLLAKHNAALRIEEK